MSTSELLIICFIRLNAFLWVAVHSQSFEIDNSCNRAEISTAHGKLPVSHINISIVLSSYVQTYIIPFYILEAYKNCYSQAIIFPYNDNFLQRNIVSDKGSSDNGSSNDSNDDILLPPNIKHQLDHLKKYRIRSQKEGKENTQKRVQKCRLCHKVRTGIT